jgi:hypothetical protein
VKLEDPVVYADVISFDEVSNTEVNVTKLFFFVADGTK